MLPACSTASPTLQLFTGDCQKQRQQLAGAALAERGHALPRSSKPTTTSALFPCHTRPLPVRAGACPWLPSPLRPCMATCPASRQPQSSWWAAGKKLEKSSRLGRSVHVRPGEWAPVKAHPWLRNHERYTTAMHTNTHCCPPAGCTQTLGSLHFGWLWSRWVGAALFHTGIGGLVAIRTLHSDVAFRVAVQQACAATGGVACAGAGSHAEGSGPAASTPPPPPPYSVQFIPLRRRWLASTVLGPTTPPRALPPPAPCSRTGWAACSGVLRPPQPWPPARPPARRPPVAAGLAEPLPSSRSTACSSQHTRLPTCLTLPPPRKQLPHQPPRHRFCSRAEGPQGPHAPHPRQHRHVRGERRAFRYFSRLCCNALCRDVLCNVTHTVETGQGDGRAGGRPASSHRGPPVACPSAAQARKAAEDGGQEGEPPKALDLLLGGTDENGEHLSRCLCVGVWGLPLCRRRAPRRWARRWARVFN